MYDRDRNEHTDQTQRWETLARMLNEGRRIAVLTGAGISTDSGLPDFRSKGGIFDNELRVEDILSESYFHAQPKRFWEHFKAIFRFEELHQCKPNAGHLLLKELEEKGKEVVVMTQNIDGLHGKAGSRRVLEVHGTLSTAACPKCKERYGAEAVMGSPVPRCGKDGFILKPDVVLYGGRVLHMEEAYESVRQADVFLVMGTSLQVYPVKDLPYAVERSRTKSVIVNREPTGMDGLFDLVIHDEIRTAAEQLRGRLL